MSGPQQMRVGHCRMTGTAERSAAQFQAVFDNSVFLLYNILKVFLEQFNEKEIQERLMADLSSTQFFRINPEKEVSAKKILKQVYEAMEDKGYDPVSQIVGYIMSGDPTYITSHNGARSVIMKTERDELVEELLKEYIRNKSWEGDPD